MGCLFRFCSLVIFAMLIGWLITNLVNFIQEAPAVKINQTVTLTDFKTAQQLVRRRNSHLRSPNKVTEFQTTTHEINSFLKVAAKLIPNAANQVKASGGGIVVQMSVSLPSNPLGSYLNIRTIIASSSQGLLFKKFFVGKVKIHQKLIKPVLYYAFDQIIGQGRTKTFINDIRSVKVSNSKLFVRFWPSAYLTKDIRPGGASNRGDTNNANGVKR